MVLMDFINAAKEIGLPFTALFGVLFVVYKVGMAAISAFSKDRDAQREAQSQDAKLQNALLDRYAQAVQAIATNTAAIVSNTAEVVGIRSDIPRELSNTFERAQKDREQITTTVKTHVTDIIKPVAEGVAALNDKVATHDDVTQLATVAGASKAESVAERDAHREELSKLSDAYRALATKIDSLPDAIAGALAPILEGHVRAMGEFVEKASPTPARDVLAHIVAPAPADGHNAPDPLAAPTKRATGTLSAVASDVTPPDAKREAEAT